MLKKLTQSYIEAFNNKNLEKISSLLDENFILEDPAVKHLEGKQKCLEAINNIFENHSKLHFEAKRIYIDGNTSFIEFILKLNEKNFQGVDIIEWKNEKIIELRAYLYEL